LLTSSDITDSVRNLLSFWPKVCNGLCLKISLTKKKNGIYRSH